MPRQSAISHEARDYIIDEIERRGIVEIEDIVKLAYDHYQFDPMRAKEREIKAWARRLFASIKSSDGTRSVLSVKGSPGVFVNLDTCKDFKAVDNVVNQLKEKRDGLNRTLKKAERRRTEIVGQQSLLISDNSQHYIEIAHL